MRIHLGTKLWYDLDKDSVLSLISGEKTDDALHENLAPFSHKMDLGKNYAIYLHPLNSYKLIGNLFEVLNLNQLIGVSVTSRRCPCSLTWFLQKKN